MGFEGTNYYRCPEYEGSRQSFFRRNWWVRALKSGKRHGRNCFQIWERQLWQFKLAVKSGAITKDEIDSKCRKNFGHKKSGLVLTNKSLSKPRNLVSDLNQKQVSLNKKSTLRKNR